MSTFDEYVAEVRCGGRVLLKTAPSLDHTLTRDTHVLHPPQVKSGKLEWSPVHRSERFWRENVTRLNDKKHELLKLLVNYLTKSEDVTVSHRNCDTAGPAK
jgi:hypothetical protein